MGTCSTMNKDTGHFSTKRIGHSVWDSHSSALHRPRLQFFSVDRWFSPAPSVAVCGHSYVKSLSRLFFYYVNWMCYYICVITRSMNYITPVKTMQSDQDISGLFLCFCKTWLQIIFFGTKTVLVKLKMCSILNYAEKIIFHVVLLTKWCFFTQFYYLFCNT